VRLLPATLLLAVMAPAVMGAAPPASAPEVVLGLGDGFTLQPERSFAHLTQRIEIFRLDYGGLPVFGRSCAIQRDGRGAIRRASRCAVTAATGAAAPRDGAAESAAAAARARAEGLEVLAAEPGWIVGGDDRLEPVIRVEAAAGPLLPEPMAIFYHAGSLVAIDAEPLLETASTGGRVFADNPMTTPEPIEVELTDLDEPIAGLNGIYARVARCTDVAECLATAPTARPNKEGEFFYEPDLGEFTFDDPFVEVNVYHHATRFARWMGAEFGWTGLFLDHQWIEIKVGIAWYNAAYYGGNSTTAPLLIFGQDVIDMGYDADVVCHEYGHAVNHTAWSHPSILRDEYGVDNSPVGVEEALADIWAETFNGDPVMNAYVTRSRTAANAYVCPDNVAGEGHYEARFLSAFGWDVRERIGAAAWDQIVYRTIPFLPSAIVFADFVAGLENSAADLAAEGAPGIDATAVQAIHEEATARGLLSEACAARLVPMADGVTRGVYGYGRPRTSHRDRPFGLQWVFTAPEGAAAFRLDLALISSGTAAPGYRAHISRGAPVAVTWLDPETVPEGEPEFEVAADLTIEGAPPHVDFPEAGQPPLAAGEKVYVLFSADTEDPIFALSGTPFFLAEQPPPEDAGPPASQEVAAASWTSGTGCAAAPAAGRGAGLIGALLGGI
jgi:hypothetical protein